MIFSPKILCLTFSPDVLQAMASTPRPFVLSYLLILKPGRRHIHLISNILQLIIRPKKSFRQAPRPNALFLWTIQTMMADDPQSLLVSSRLSREQQAGVVLISKNAISHLKICPDTTANPWLRLLPHPIYPATCLFFSA